MRKIKILGLVVIMMVGLSLASSVTRSIARHSDPEVVTLVCDLTGLLQVPETNALSTTPPEGLIRTGTCQTNLIGCGACTADLIGIAGCRHKSTRPVGTGGGRVTITLICPWHIGYNEGAPPSKGNEGLFRPETRTKSAPRDNRINPPYPTLNVRTEPGGGKAFPRLLLIKPEYSWIQLKPSLTKGEQYNKAPD